MVGDGSGNLWNIGGGWATVVVDRFSGGRHLLWGGWSRAAIMPIELMAYVHALAWYDADVGDDRRKVLRKDALRVHVICDNETVVRQGNGEIGRDKMLPWWACWGGLLRLGYAATFHWVPGHDKAAQLGLNVLTDHVSRCARKAVEGLSMAAMVPGRPTLTPYDVNPGG